MSNTKKRLNKTTLLGISFLCLVTLISAFVSYTILTAPSPKPIHLQSQNTTYITPSLIPITRAMETINNLPQNIIRSDKQYTIESISDQTIFLNIAAKGTTILMYDPRKVFIYHGVPPQAELTSFKALRVGQVVIIKELNDDSQHIFIL